MVISPELRRNMGSSAARNGAAVIFSVFFPYNALVTFFSPDRLFLLLTIVAFHVGPHVSRNLFSVKKIRRCSITVKIITSKSQLVN